MLGRGRATARTTLLSAPSMSSPAQRAAAVGRHVSGSAAASATAASSSAASPSSASAGPSEDVVVASSSYGLRSLKLNRPKALNALSLAMMELMQPKLEAWERSDDCNIVLLKSEGRAFCAGGDVVALVNAAREEATREQSVSFFAQEYTLDRWLARMSKPLVAFADGITMGGGLGLSMHAPFRIATERTQMSMPETTIGLFPDVGASFVLSRLDGSIGLYLGLTSERIDGWTAYQLGMASHYVPSSNLAALEDRLAHLEQPADAKSMHELINTAINEFTIDADAASKLANPLSGRIREAIDVSFRHTDLQRILADLDKLAEGKHADARFADDAAVANWAGKTAAAIRLRSPTSCAVTVEALKRGRKMSIDEVFDQDMRISSACVDYSIYPDFVTGVTDKLIKKLDKGKPTYRPEWSPSTIEEVKPSEIRRIFFDSPAPMRLPVPALGALPPTVASTPAYTARPFPQYTLPTEDEIKLAITGEAPYDRSSFAPRTKDVVDRLNQRFGSKVGLRAKVEDVIARKATRSEDGSLSWT